MKRILIFSLAYYPKHIGGAEVAVKEITDRISPEEIEFHMITNRYDSTLPKVEKVGNVLVHRIGIATKDPDMADLRKFPLHINKLLFQFFAYFKARQLHKEYSYDGIWAMMAHATGVPAGLFKGAFHDVQYVLTLQEGDTLEHIEKKMRLFGRLFDNAFTRADVIQSISTFLERWAKKKGFTGKSIVVPNGVDVAHFTHSSASEKLEEDQIFLVTTSRLVHKNGIDDVIRAMKHLPAHVHFLVFGTGPEKQKLNALISELDLTDRVHMRGHIDREFMPKYLKTCDIFVRPSRSEGMGNSFIEAMAAGIPVIATQEGGIADFLFDAKRNPDKETTGWAVDKNSPEQIVHAVEDIMQHPQKAAEVVRTAQKMVEEKYDWDLVARDMQREVFSKI